MNTMAKILLPALALAPLLLLSAGGDESAPVPPQRQSFEGRVRGWAVDASGTVSLALEGELSGKPFSLWFSTAANRTSATNFEELVLDAVLELSRHGTNDAKVTVTADTGNQVSGKTPAEALMLVGLRRE